MMPKLILHVVLRQLWAKKGLHGVAVMGVMLGVLTHVAISGLMNGTTETFFTTILQISPHVVLKNEAADKDRTARPPGFEGPSAIAYVRAPRGESRQRIQRPFEVADQIQKLADVEASTPFVAGNAVVTSGARERPVEIRGVDPKRQDLVTPLRAYIRAGSYDALAQVPDGILIGTLLAQHLGVKVGERVSCAGQGAVSHLVVVGLFETNVSAADRGRVYANLRQAQALLGKGDAVDGIEMRLRDTARAPAVTEIVERTFGYDAESWQEANANFLGLIAQQEIAVNLVIAALLAVGGFGILSIQIMIVGQKRRDIAILRSTGFRRADILAIFLVQGVAVALVGSAIGSLAGHFAVLWMRTVRAGGDGGTVFRTEFLPVTESLGTYLAGATFATLVGILASLVPAWRASRVEPVDVLRGHA